jgi:hypothetical protein
MRPTQTRGGAVREFWGAFLRVCSADELARELAVEFPSPCNGSDSARRAVFGGLVQVRTSGPSKKCNLYRKHGVDIVFLGCIVGFDSVSGP